MPGNAMRGNEVRRMAARMHAVIAWLPTMDFNGAGLATMHVATGGRRKMLHEGRTMAWLDGYGFRDGTLHQPCCCITM